MKNLSAGILSVFAALTFVLVPQRSCFGSEGPATPADKGESPVVALVLSGGGAKGAAHVGAIKYLESLGYDFDMVVGTSMGSIIGGLYSLGYTGTEIDSLIKELQR